MNTKTGQFNCPATGSRQRIRAALLASLLLTASAIARSDVVSDWNQVAESLVVSNPAPPGTYYALVHLAIYDAVNAIDGKHTAYAIHPSAPTDGASQEAAVAAAAYSMLSQLLVNQADALDQAYANSLAAIPDGTPKERGIAVGKEVAIALLELRKNDHRYEAGSYDFRYEPGDYQATPPGFPNPILPALGRAQPFAIRRGVDFRAEGPPDLTSVKYTSEFREVKKLGSATSTARTPEQTEIARFYLEGPATFWTRNYRNFIEGENLSTSDAARLYAMLSTAFADASIACWDSKYYFNSWRPVTAIQHADTDGNPGTGADPTWEPLAATPPHPEYPSAHACNTSAMNEVLAAFYGTREIPMTLTSLVPGTTPHHFNTLEEQNQEVIEARILAGFHFRSANVAGIDLGRRVGRYITARYFLPVESPSSWVSVAGTWSWAMSDSNEFGGAITWTITSDGHLGGRDATGCDYAGQLRLIDAPSVTYELDLTVTGCPLAGKYSGLANKTSGPFNDVLHVSVDDGDQRTLGVNLLSADTPQ